MVKARSDGKSARFDLRDIASEFPETAKTMLLDTYLTYEETASARVFRAYSPTPPHYHQTCDEYLLVLSGRGTFWIEEAANEAEFAPMQLLHFKKGVVHALPKLIEGPIVFFSVDTPRRNPSDVVFVNPDEGSPDSFIQSYGSVR